MGQYLPLVILLILALLFGLLSRVASAILAPRRPSSAKSAPYECGIEDVQDPPREFPVTFYVVAMLFIMFDVEIIFLYPYAVAAGELGMFGFWAILLFSVIFFATFVYEVARGGLEWGPIDRHRRVDRGAEMISAERTSTTSIRRVGREGREFEHEADSDEADSDDAASDDNVGDEVAA